jgi:hypothetical protein
VDTIKTELVPGSAKRDRRGRRILSAERWREAIASYEKSELTQQEFCRREGINLHTFVARLGRTRRVRLATVPAGGFIAAKLPTLGWPNLSLALEVVLPDGVIVRGREALAVATLVRALGGK